MIEYYTIALDIGTTFIRSALLDENGNILPESFSIFSSKSSESKEIILENFVKIIKFNINSILYPDFKIQHIGLTFSSAFLSNKQETLLDKKKLQSSLMRVPSIQGKLSKNCDIHFEEDAPLFAIGEHVLRKKENQNKRVLYLILGSSLASAFMVNGHLITNNQAILEDFISRSGIMSLAQTLDLSTKDSGPKEIAEMALDNHPGALKVFEQFGENLAQALENTIEEFLPDEIILGGNIALSYPLFSQSFLNTLSRESIQISATKYTTYYIFFGMSEYIKKINHCA